MRDSSTTLVSNGPGAVVMVSFRPRIDLFRAQLESIRNQTRSDFQCYIAADGDVRDTALVVQQIVGDDSRFHVIGFDNNVGVFLNVERALQRVPHDVSWIAIADQDDRWHVDKLQRLLPLLDGGADLATGQARVVEWPSTRVLMASTARSVAPAAHLLLQNSVSGGMSVLRRDLLDLALPFPRYPGPGQYPDHWIAFCAASRGGIDCLEAVVQDYVQHGSNLVGESSAGGHVRPFTSLRKIRLLADQWEGGHSVGRCLRAWTRSTFSWRRAWVAAVLGRGETTGELQELATYLDPTSGTMGALRAVGMAGRSPHVSRATLLGFLAGLPYEVWHRRPQHSDFADHRRRLDRRD